MQYYYGKTERYLKVRPGERKLRLHYREKVSIRATNLPLKITLPFTDFTILNYKSHKFKRLIKESLLVTKATPVLNKRDKSQVYYTFNDCNYLIDILVEMLI